MKILLKNGRIIDPANKIDGKMDLLAENGKIAAIGEDITVADEETQIIDATDKVILPGLIDMHVHLREPGQEAKEDFVSGGMAAVAGGFTRVATMPNTSPVVDNAALVRGLKKRAAEANLAKIEIIGAVTKGQKGEELAEMGDMAAAGAAAFSDDGHFIDSAKMMLNAFSYIKPFDKIIINHEEETTLVEGGVMNEGLKSALLGVKGRPTVAEDIAIMRDILLAEYAGAKVHVAHISTAVGANFVREAKKRGVKVTAEVTPQHLTLTDDMVNLTDTATKINPPLRSKNDAEALFAALKDGTIDIIVTDHSPHANEEKDREYIYAPSGFPGLETSLAVMLTDFYHTGKLTLTELAEKMSLNPAKIFNLAGGTLSVGAAADIAVVDTELDWTARAKDFYTKCKYSPFDGKKMKGKAVLTIVGGRIVMKDGKITGGAKA